MSKHRCVCGHIRHAHPLGLRASSIRSVRRMSCSFCDCPLYRFDHTPADSVNAESAIGVRSVIR